MDGWLESIEVEELEQPWRNYPIRRFFGVLPLDVGVSLFILRTDKFSYRCFDCLFTSGIRKLLNAVFKPLFTGLQERVGRPLVADPGVSSLMAHTPTNEPAKGL